MANVSKLLFGAPDNLSLLSKLDLLPAERKRLTDARDKIKATLSAAIEANPIGGKKITPRFYTQGSYAYRTLNRGDRMPPQQIDLDYGCYLPMSIMKEAKRPDIAAAAFFEIADMALRALARRENWGYDDEKDTCCRLLVSDRIHIDVPLYAIPDDEFKRLHEVAAMKALTTDELSEDFPFMYMGVSGRQILPSDRVMLAHRKDDWQESDPRKIHAWVVEFVRDYGEIARRVCRYLKAWRDHHPALEKVSSLSLMAATFYAFVDFGPDDIPKREDEALALAVAKLPELFNSGEILNPAEKSENLIERLPLQDRRAIVERAMAFAKDLDSVIHTCRNAQVALEKMIAAFGTRIPYRPDFVSTEMPVETVLATPAVIAAQPKVGRSNSG